MLTIMNISKYFLNFSFFCILKSSAFALDFELTDISYPSKRFEQVKCSGTNVTLRRGILGDGTKTEVIASLELTEAISAELKKILDDINPKKLSPKKSDWMPDSDGTLDGKFWYFEVRTNDGKSFVYANAKPMDGLEELKFYINKKLMLVPPQKK